MEWWQILLVFVGIPAAMFLAVTALVLRLATARVPDGLARMAADPGRETVSEEADSAPELAEPEGQPTGE